MSPIVAFLSAFGVTFVAAFVGSTASIGAGNFYRALVRPAWAPPSNVFGPVWTVLYLMMALSAALAWSKSGSDSRVVVPLFLVQLALNALWSWAFFRWESGPASMCIIVLLWVAIVAMTLVFWKTSLAAAMLLIPYLAWVTFAAGLNFAIWRMNPTLL